MKYRLIRSDRKTLAIEVTAEGELIVRAPKRCRKAIIEAFLQEKQDWIERKQEERKDRRKAQKDRQEAMEHWSESDYQKARELARIVLTQKAGLYASVMKVTYGRISIRDQKTRWGSCSAKGNLNFNWRLILAPEEIQDYVVVHELAHLKEMNHSPKFWQIVETVIPDYRKRRQWLKQHGEELMVR